MASSKKSANSNSKLRTGSPIFKWDDPFQIEGQLQKEERLVRDMVRKYATDKLMPRVIEAHRTKTFHREILKEMGDLGLLGMTLEGYGCPGASYVSYGLAAREIERVDSSYRSAFSVQSSLVMYAIHTFGSEAQKEKYIPKLAKGELVGCFGLTEPDFGSDPSGMKSNAKKTKDGWVLNGTKTWITNSPIADIAIVWVKDDDKVVRGFILERGMKGFETPKIENKLSLQISITGEISMNNVAVTEEHILPESEGLKSPLRCLNKARLGIAWGAIGAAEFCWHAARDYVRERKQFDKPLAANQLVQQKLANMQTELTIALQAVLQATRLKDEEKCTFELISLIKRNSCAKALDAARTARDMLGANGVADEYHVMRHMMNLEAVNTYEGTHDIHTLILGQAQTGLAAF